MKNDLLPFKLIDPRFIGVHDRGVACFDDPIKKAVDLPADIMQLLLKLHLLFMSESQTHAPSIAQHCFCQLKKTLRWLKALQDFRQTFFHLGTRHGFALGLATPCFTAIIGIMAILPFRPGSSHSVAATIACNKSTKWKIFVEISACCRATFATFENVLNLLMRLKADQAFVMAFANADTPLIGLDIPCIDRLLQKPRHGHGTECSVLFVLRKMWIAFKKSLYFSLRSKVPCRKAFKCGLHNRGKHLVGNKNFAATAGGGCISITNGCSEDPKTTLHAGLHLLDNLTTVLLALQFTLGRDHRLNEFAFGCILDTEVQALNGGTAHHEFAAQF